jgi:hypothetical protein
MTIPKLCIDVLCGVEDGTDRACLKILDKNAIIAFNINEDNKDYFKQYCKNYGSFFHPSKPQDIPNQHMYNEILKIFRQTIAFNTVSVVAVPFCKISRDKQGMNEMVSRPNYVLSENDKSMGVYLNGDITKKKLGKKFISKTKCCFKAIEVLANINMTGYEDEI